MESWTGSDLPMHPFGTATFSLANISNNWQSPREMEAETGREKREGDRGGRNEQQTQSWINNVAVTVPVLDLQNYNVTS